MSNHLQPFISYIVDDNTDEKLKDLFDFYDVDGNGMIQRHELINVLSLCAHEIGLEVDLYLEQIADAVFSNANLNQYGSITLEALKDVLKKRPNLTNELSLSREASHDSDENTSKTNCHGCQSETCEGIRSYLFNKWDQLATTLGCNKLRWEYISNNFVSFGFALAIIIITAILSISRIYAYWGAGLFVIIARCGGQCLNFLCSIIVLLVCRRSISYLRANGYGRYLPLDDNVYFHKFIGIFIVIYSFIHTIGHLINFALIAQDPKFEFTYWELLFSLKPGIGWLGGSACLTGWLLLVIILIMSSAHRFSRSLGHFELFYFTHLLYIPFWALLFIHAPNFWLWFAAPFTIFSIETLIRLKNLLTNLMVSGKTEIIKAFPLPSDVIHLVIKRPPSFQYNPGDWIYVLVPQIAKYEWHPFTISSAPEQEGVICLHIRAVGEWTRSLRSYFENIEHRNHLSRFIKSGYFSVSMEQFTVESNVSDSTRANVKMPNLTIFIDGPYGSPSSQIFSAEHAVLIATGIGVTPFASILQSFVKNYEKRLQKCPNCANEFYDPRPPIGCTLRKIDFVWINRDQKSFEWFIKLLAELELTQAQLPPSERFLDIHIHLTAMEPAKTKSIGLQLALYLVHEKNKKDLVTGLRTRTKAGRPNWDDFFEDIQEQKKGKVSVFFCGRPQLGRQLHRQCDKFGFQFRKEIF